MAISILNKIVVIGCSNELCNNQNPTHHVPALRIKRIVKNKSNIPQAGFHPGLRANGPPSGKIKMGFRIKNTCTWRVSVDNGCHHISWVNH
jgi:hypothetical protein